VSVPDGPVEEVAALIHSEMCIDGPECGRWNRERPSDHRTFYQGQARAIFARLEPEIGAANVFLAVSVTLDVVL
jgi:hypothetical protein